MQSQLLSSLSLVDLSGSLIIAAIVLLLVLAVLTTFLVRLRYARIIADLRRTSEDSLFRTPLLNKLVGQVRSQTRQRTNELNTQGMIEHAFQSELGLLLIGERFVKASAGLLIILGLVGTFYGLTESIGKLVQLVSGDFDGASEVTESLVRGLTEALSGMSVAFSTSLAGILAAILMSLLGVFANVTERRTSLMLELETFLDGLAQPPEPWSSAEQPGGAANAMSVTGQSAPDAGFVQAVSRLEVTIERFESALNQFSSNTRDLHEFNAHLRDNVQRLSLSFADLSNTVQDHTRALVDSRPRGDTR